MQIRSDGHSPEAVLALMAQMRRQGDGITARYAGGEGVSGRFSDFQAFIDQIDHYQLFIDMIEARLDNLSSEDRAAQERNLIEIRWNMLRMEIEATGIFLGRMVAGDTPWPMGSQPFLRRRLSRLDEISAFHAAHAMQYTLASPDAAMMQKIRDMVASQIGRSLALADFAMMPPEPGPEPPVPPAPVAEPQRKPAGKPAAKPVKAGETKRAIRLQLQLRDADGYKYIDGDGLAVVSEACRIIGVSLDEFAKGLELSRPGLVLILNGRDPVNPGLLKVLRRFIARAGGAPVA